MEKERIMLAVECADKLVLGALFAVMGYGTGEIARDTINEGNPLGWAVFAVAGSYLAIVLIKKLLEKRLAGAGEAVE